MTLGRDVFGSWAGDRSADSLREDLDAVLLRLEPLAVTTDCFRLTLPFPLLFCPFVIATLLDLADVTFCLFLRCRASFFAAFRSASISCCFLIERQPGIFFFLAISARSLTVCSVNSAAVITDSTSDKTSTRSRSLPGVNFDRYSGSLTRRQLLT